jgi:hypothetical protein
LARDLEDERPERVKRGKLVQPGPRTEVRPRINQPRENRIRLAKELARLGIVGGASSSTTPSEVVRKADWYVPSVIE